MSVNYTYRIKINDSIVMFQIMASLTDNSRRIVSNCNVFIVQAYGRSRGQHKTVACLMVACQTCSIFAGNFCGKFLREIFAGYFCGKFLQEILTGNFDRKFWQEIFVGNFWPEILAGNFGRKFWQDILA
jgi:hypothetical protein